MFIDMSFRLPSIWEFKTPPRTIFSHHSIGSLICLLFAVWDDVKLKLSDTEVSENSRMALKLCCEPPATHLGRWKKIR